MTDSHELNLICPSNVMYQKMLISGVSNLTGGGVRKKQKQEGLNLS